eukprot:5223139-Pyramimonas_sp.AAC.1
MGPRSVTGVCRNERGGGMRAQPLRAFGGAPYGATNRARGVPKCVWGRHAGAATGAFGGDPYGATKR